MAKKQIEQVKNSKNFKLCDIVVYGLVAVLIVCLFIAFVFVKKPTELKEVELVFDEKILYSYNFDEDKELNSNSSMIKSEKSEKGYLVYFYYTENEYNCISIDTKKREVSVVESNCSTSKECVHMPKIKDGNGIIACVPHKLIIRGVGEIVKGPTSG